MSLKTYNSVFEKGNTADYATASTWTAIATGVNVEKIKPPMPKAKVIPATHLARANEFEDFIAGLADGGEMTLTVQYDKTANLAVYALYRTTNAYRVKYSDNSGWKFNGFITDFGDQEIVNGDIIRTDITFKVTGKPVHDDDLTS